MHTILALLLALTSSAMAQENDNAANAAPQELVDNKSTSEHEHRIGIFDATEEFERIREEVDARMRGVSFLCVLTEECTVDRDGTIRRKGK